MPHEPSDAFVFFGATGDLAYKQIFPALQAMIQQGELEMPIIGVAKSGWNVEQLRERAHNSLKDAGGVDERAFAKLVERLQYIDGDYHDARTFEQLRTHLGDAQRPLHYLAVPPSLFAEVTSQLAGSGCAENARIVVEKPFGRDLTSARQLNRVLRQYFDEDDIFRIDHFLGKEAVQNIVFFRFANSFLEPIWNRQYIANVRVNLAENFGVQGRGHFYEEVGAIRDVVQNHLLQVVTLLAMEAPSRMDIDSLRDQKAILMKSIRPLRPQDVVRGQFTGYRQEKGVAPDSDVETFAALRLFIDNWRWAGVPFFIRTGKCLPVTTTDVLVELKRPPQTVFPGSHAAPPNRIYLQLSPDVMIKLTAQVKQAGEEMVGEEVALIARHYAMDYLPPYARLLGDALQGDATLFTRVDAVEAAWRVVDPVVANRPPIHEYAPNTWGPPEADEIVRAVGGWHNQLLTPSELTPTE